jgi:hypothetical protein
MAGQGRAWLGTAWLGKAWAPMEHVVNRISEVSRHGVARQGKARCGWARQGLLWSK